jgi:hypothetical protein
MTSKNPSPSAGYCGTCGRKLPPSREVDEEGNICAWNPCEFCNEKAKAQAGFMPQGVVQQALEATQPITCEQHLAKALAENTDLKRRLKGMEEALEGISLRWEQRGRRWDIELWKSLAWTMADDAAQALKDYSLPSPNNA